MKSSRIISVLVAFAALSAAQPALVQQGNKLAVTGALSNFGNYGWAVALSADGNTAIVGGSEDNQGVGAAWVFTRTNGVWLQQGNKLIGTGAIGEAGQGRSVALSGDGNTALIGGGGDNGGVGAAWVFTRTNGVWLQQGNKLVGSGAIGSAGQGTSVALSGDGSTALVGGAEDNNYIGATWVFTRAGGVWTQQGGKLVSADEVGQGYEGSVAALSDDGNTAIIGGSLDGDLGAAWIFTRTAGVWTQQGGKLVGTDGAGTRQGFSVALSGDGNTAMMGGVDLGDVWVFTRSAGVWTQQGGKLAVTGATGDYLSWGTSVALSGDGNIALIGGPGDNDTVGAVWIFTRSAGVWSQQGPKLTGSNPGNESLQGSRSALSRDGQTAFWSTGDNEGAAWVFVTPATFVSTPILNISTTLGDLQSGQASAAFNIDVDNSGLVATNGAVIVTGNALSGLTLGSMSGTGWDCSAVIACTRSDALSAGAAYPSIAVTVNVDTNAQYPEFDAAASGGGSGTAVARVSPNILPPPFLSLRLTHTGYFAPGQIGAVYTVVVTDSSFTSSVGNVTVTEMAPASLTVTGMSGSGWTCAGVTCTRNDALAGGASYPPITVTVNVAANAATPQVNMVSVSGGGSATDSASDSTVIGLFPGFKEYTLNLPGGPYTANQIAAGPDNALWVTTSWAGCTFGSHCVPMSFIGRITVAGSSTQLFSPKSDQNAVTAGPDGNVWYTAPNGTIIGELSPETNAVSLYAGETGLGGITAGSDGAIWFTDSQGVGRITTSGAVTHLGAASAAGGAIAGGPDGALWFTESGKIGRITTGGTITEFPLPPGHTAYALVGGPDSAVWFTDPAANSIGRITSAGVLAWYPLPTPSASPGGIVTGQDGALWFTEATHIGRITTAGAITENSVPAIGTSLAAGADGAIWFLEPGTSKIGRLALAAGEPVLGIALTNANLTQGQTGTYMASIFNQSGDTATSGIVTVTATFPTGLSGHGGLYGLGWTCAPSGATCSRSDPLQPGAYYPDIVITVDVGSNAPASLTVEAGATGGNSVPVSASETVSVAASSQALLSVGNAAGGIFTAGQTGATYTLTVSNSVFAKALSGTVTVTDTVPAGLTLRSMSGDGWTCAPGGNACSRGDGLPPAASFPPITVIVDIASNAPSQVTNQASLSGGNAASASTSVTTTLGGSRPAFFTGEQALSDNVYYLQFPGTGALFGYYSNQFFPILYHFNLGFEGFLDAHDGSGGAYLFDFGSSHWWFTSPSSFPAIFDFTLNQWIWSFPGGSPNSRLLGYLTGPLRGLTFAL